MDENKINAATESRLLDKFSLGYVIALLLIACLSFSAHYLIKKIIILNQDAASVINVAGRQRMLFATNSLAQRDTE